VNDIESIETVPTLLTVVVRVVPPNVSEYVVPDVDGLGAFPEGFQFAMVAQLVFEPPVHVVGVPAKAPAGATTHSITAMSISLREHRTDTPRSPGVRNILKIACVQVAELVQNYEPPKPA